MVLMMNEKISSGYVIIGGAGQVGYFLAKKLLGEQYEVTLIDRDSRRVKYLENELGDSVMQGDACSARTLERAGARRADYILAVTGEDEDNLVICQLAQYFQVKRTIARVNNMALIPFFKSKGISAVVCPTSNILEVIVGELSIGAVVHFAPFSQAEWRPIEAVIPDDSPVLGQTISSIGIEPSIKISLIHRGEESILPTPATTIEVGDRLFAVVNRDGEELLKTILLGES
jgi:trk system potassium uptake protein TrkA